MTILFEIYMNDIAEASSIYNFIISADDATLSTILEMVLKDGNVKQSKLERSSVSKTMGILNKIKIFMAIQIKVLYIIP